VLSTIASTFASKPMIMIVGVFTFLRSFPSVPMKPTPTGRSQSWGYQVTTASPKDRWLPSA